LSIVSLRTTISKLHQKMTQFIFQEDEIQIPALATCHSRATI
jgi:hypothetical protein